MLVFVKILVLLDLFGEKGHYTMFTIVQMLKEEINLCPQCVLSS